MKKNVMMRAAGGLLVAVMLTTSVVSGTYAKYVTSDSGNDTARVAKFGVVATVAGDLFGPSYTTANNGNGIQVWSQNAATVAASDAKTTNVVAPGTKNGKGMKITVKGTPEVSTTLAVADIDDATTHRTNTDIYLAANSTLGYGVMVEVTGVEVNNDNKTDYYTKSGDTYTKLDSTSTLNSSDKYYRLKDVANDTESIYYPLTWSVDSTPLTVNNNTVAGVLSSIQAANGSKAPNETWDITKTITWEWKFEDGTQEDATNGIYKNDRKDTILGDMITEAMADTGFGNADVVKINSATEAVAVHYTNIKVSNDTKEQNEAWYAYTGNTAPTAETISGNANVVACLTVNFGAEISVVQVD